MKMGVLMGRGYLQSASIIAMLDFQYSGIFLAYIYHFIKN